MSRPSVTRPPLRPLLRPVLRSPLERGWGGLNGSLIVFLGDSITEQNGGLAANPTFWAHTGFYQHALAYSGWRFTASNKGVAGQTSSAMLARITTDVLYQRPKYCHLLCGTNDTGQGISTTTCIANIESMVAAMQAIGITPIVGTIPPRSSYTGSIKADLETINAHIRTMPVTVVDYHAALDDGTGVAIGGTLSDGVHPNRNGASRMGVALAEVLSQLPSVAYPLITEAGTSGVQLLQYGRFQGGADGATPTGWSLLGSATLGREARDVSIGGNWLTLSVAESGVAALTSNVSVGSSLAIGDRIIGEVEFDASPLAAPPAKTLRFGLYLQAWNGSSFFSSASTLRGDASQDNDHDTAKSGVIRTPVMTVESPAQLVQMVIQCSGGGTYKLDRAAMRKV